MVSDNGIALLNRKKKNKSFEATSDERRLDLRKMEVINFGAL